jgi:hypothetical protein
MQPFGCLNYMQPFGCMSTGVNPAPLGSRDGRRNIRELVGCYRPQMGARFALTRCFASWPSP